MLSYEKPFLIISHTKLFVHSITTHTRASDELFPYTIGKSQPITLLCYFLLLLEIPYEPLMSYFLLLLESPVVSVGTWNSSPPTRLMSSFLLLLEILVVFYA